MNSSTLKTGLIVTAVALLSASAEQKAYDGFNVPADYKNRRQLIGTGGGTGFENWKVDLSGDEGNGRRYIISKDSITYTDIKGNVLMTAPGHMQCKPAGSGKAPLTRDLTSALEGTVWISFLTKMNEQIGYGWDIQFLDEKGNMVFKVMNGRTEQNRWRIQSPKQANGKPKDGLFKSKPGMTPVELTLIVLKIENAGSGSANGSVTAFLNPEDLRDAELTSMASVKIKDLQINAIKTFSFDKKSAAEGLIDELRFGERVEDVLPLQQTD